MDFLVGELQSFSSSVSLRPIGFLVSELKAGRPQGGGFSWVRSCTLRLFRPQGGDAQLWGGSSATSCRIGALKVFVAAGEEKDMGQEEDSVNCSLICDANGGEGTLQHFSGDLVMGELESLNLFLCYFLPCS